MAVDISSEIIEAEIAAGKVAYAYSRAAIFGNETEEMYWDLMRANAYVRTLDRNKEVATVCLRVDNGVSLETQTTDVEPCLSDEQICIIAGLAKALCMKYS